ncbi:UPF0061-domain-containing protein [Auriscalpium vulgare]|uniref:UPF0061-domain-containing protein n=1 Tax=Auriscalpium vulgare TaxID=40419 RepID=A0ACB8RZQ1_9AGAM|nr:UPF0061-domain-containing protein [Auriscalpium vulgare]
MRAFRQLSSMSIQKYPISALPLPPPSKLLIHNLNPDPATPSVSAFHDTRKTAPSIQRRARILSPEAHFSFVAPYPVSFPYDIQPPEGEEPADRSAFLEKWLSDREALHPKTTAARTDLNEKPLQKLYPEKREQRMELLGLSETGLRDCLPHLDVGDAFELLGKFSLSDCSVNEEDRKEMKEDEAARQELIAVLGGHAVLVSAEDAEVKFAPWSLRYSGHQFGVWAGQLGDGRAISVLATLDPKDPDSVWELQLKGAGRTPFARSADGLAVVRSSIREYLCAEAMYALGIPTSRSLAIISLPDLPVLRERTEAASIVTRLAPSFIRIGSFEALNPPAQMFFFGGGQQAADLDALRMLGEWVSDNVLRVPRNGGAWGRAIVLEATKRNARMVAGWQAYGFMHGVINTDNVSILGLTIDYGPYAFMDVFDPMHICNHTDGEGRYAYKHQPAMIMFALRSLLTALAPVIGAEAELGNKAVGEGWAKDVDEEKIKGWREKGIELVEKEFETLFHAEYDEAYGEHMRKRFGLKNPADTDDSALFAPFLALLADQRLDFHLSFRHLATFRPALLSPASADALAAFVETFFGFTSDPGYLQRDVATQSWLRWLEKLAARVEGEVEGDADAALEKWAERVRAANPRFVLRQWVLEEVIARVEADAESGKRVLGKIMQMASSPFEQWGAEGDERPDTELDAETKEERRFCGVGDKKMLGFQCSCSS